MTYTPDEYALEVWAGKVTGATVRNWIKGGKLPKNTRAETTPTGKYLIHVDAPPASKAQELFKLMESRVA